MDSWVRQASSRIKNNTFDLASGQFMQDPSMPDKDYGGPVKAGPLRGLWRISFTVSDTQYWVLVNLMQVTMEPSCGYQHLCTDSKHIVSVSSCSAATPLKIFNLCNCCQTQLSIFSILEWYLDVQLGRWRLLHLCLQTTVTHFSSQNIASTYSKIWVTGSRAIAQSNSFYSSSQVWRRATPYA